jgi:hypothetical protein
VQSARGRLELADVHATITQLPDHDNDQQAAALYQRIRAHDQRLHAVAAQAAALVRGWTGYPSALLGSFSLGLNVDTSDLDLGLAVHPHALASVAGCLDGPARFKGERRSTPTSTRLVFGASVDGVSIDIVLLPPADHQILLTALARCRQQMPHPDKFRHVWHKHLLRQAGHRQAYEVFKLGPYLRYCPEFTWTPVL